MMPAVHVPESLTLTLGVVPIVFNAGAAVLPAVLVGLASMMAMLLRPSQWGRLVREKPHVPVIFLLVVALGVGAWYCWPAGESNEGRGGRDGAPRTTAGATDWTAVALAYLREKEMGGARIIIGGSEGGGDGQGPVSGDQRKGDNGDTAVNDNSSGDATQEQGIPMRLNAQRNGYAGGPSPTNLRFAWSYIDPEDEFAQFLSSPAIKGPWIYASTCTLSPPTSKGSVVCIDARTGQRRWVSYQLPSADSVRDMAGIYSSPALTADGSRVMVGMGLHPDRNMSLLCLDAATGKLVWEVTSPLHVESSPAIAGDIVVAGAGAVEDPVSLQPARGDNPGYVFGVRISTGEELWRVELADPESSPVIVDGVAYIGSGLNGAAVAAIRIADDRTLQADGLQRLVWKTDTPYPVMAPVTVAGETLLVGCGKGDVVVAAADPVGAVLAIDRASGTITWKRQLPDTVLGAIAVKDDRAIVPVRNGEIIALDLAKQGEVLWRRRVSETSAVIAGPAFTGTHVYGVSDDGFLVVLDARNGELLERVYLNRQDRPGELRLSVSAPVIAHGSVFVGSETGGLQALAPGRSGGGE